MTEDKKTTVEGNRFPLFKATTTPTEFIFRGFPYVGYSTYLGFTPMVDITITHKSTTNTLIINQVSVGKELRKYGSAAFQSDPPMVFRISRVAEGRMAPYKLEHVKPPEEKNDLPGSLPSDT